MPQPSPRTKCLLQLVMAQLPALLQLTQLWTVLGALSPAVDRAATVADAANVTDADDHAQGISVVDFVVAPEKFLDSTCSFCFCPYVATHCFGIVSTNFRQSDV